MNFKLSQLHMISLHDVGELCTNSIHTPVLPDIHATVRVDNRYCAIKCHLRYNKNLVL